MPGACLSNARLVLDREARRRARPDDRVLTQQDDAIAILQSHRGHGLSIVGDRILRPLDLDVRRLECDGLLAITLRVDERDAVVEIAAPDALLPCRGGRRLPGTE